MSKHNETGIKGELIAKDFLLTKGYQILATNWCHGKKEVDIIAHKDNFLVFAEVKTRSNFNYGFPEEAVTLQKKNFLKMAAEAYVDANPTTFALRFDIISILVKQGAPQEILHLEDAFF